MRVTSNLKRLLREYSGFFLLAAFVGSLVWLVHSNASNLRPQADPAPLTQNPKYGPKNKPTPRCPHCAPAGNQEIYIPLIDLPEAQGSEIVFNSRSPQAMNVTPTFYKQDGTLVVGDPVSVQSAEIRYVDIKQLLPERYRHERDWGGFSLSYNGFNREMWSQFRFMGVNGGTNIDEFFTVKAEARSSNFEAAWWMPEKSDAIVALGNITDATTSGTITFSNGHSRSVNLAPHETELVREDHSEHEGAESVTITVTGAAGSVIPTGLITAKDGSFNSVIRFYDPNAAKQPNLYANGFRVTGNTPHMVLRNTTSNSIAVVPKFTPSSGFASSFSLPQVSLAPLETAQVDLKPLLEAAMRRRDLDVVCVEVTNSAAPGSLIGSLYGINDTTGVNYDIPLRDSGLVRTMTGSYPWKISDDFTTVVYITNISDQKAEFIGQINFDGGHFVIDPRELAPGETAVFDLEKIRHEQETDNAGITIPRDISIGQFKWAIYGVTNGKLLLIGRAEMVSRSQHMSSSYSCNDPCPPYIVGSVDSLGSYLIVSDSANTSAWQRAYYDNGYSMGPYSVGADWSVDTSAASLDPSSAHTTTITGEDAEIGEDVNIAADMGWQERYSWDGLNCYDNNYAEAIGDSTSVKIAGISNAVIIETFEYSDGTAEFHMISPCDVTCTESGFVRLNLGCSSGFARKYRKQYWVKNGIGPRICIPYTVTYGNSFCNLEAACFEVTLAP